MHSNPVFLFRHFDKLNDHRLNIFLEGMGIPALSRNFEVVIPVFVEYAKRRRIKICLASASEPIIQLIVEPTVRQGNQPHRKSNVVILLSSYIG